MNEKPTIYYDAQCRLCNRWLRILRRIDKYNHIQYIALQSETGKKLTEKYNFNFEKNDTVVFEKDNHILVRSEAVIECIAHVNYFWRFVKIFRIIPLKIRDAAYNLIARNRYKWFGKADSCEIG